ncbi:GNAT family N-acetyltransferase [Rossellomorea sp. H39__3]
MNIKKATLSDLESIAHLFNEYRIFYKRPSNTEGAKTFIQERLTTGDSVIFLAGDDQGVIGFTQLYPTFTSIGMKRAWILNDLYVSEDARGRESGRLCSTRQGRLPGKRGLLPSASVQPLTMTWHAGCMKRMGTARIKSFFTMNWSCEPW